MSVTQVTERSTDDWKLYIGAQIRASRIAKRWDQQSLADNAQVSVGAIKNLECGKGSSLETLIKTIRALGRTDWLEALAPRITVSPLLALKNGKGSITQRQRVYRPRKKGEA